MPDSFRTRKITRIAGPGAALLFALLMPMLCQAENSPVNPSPIAPSPAGAADAGSAAQRAALIAALKLAYGQALGRKKEERLALAERCAQLDKTFLDAFAPKELEWERQQVMALALVGPMMGSGTTSRSDKPASSGPFNFPGGRNAMDMAAMSASVGGTDAATLPPLEPSALEKARQSGRAKADELLGGLSVDAQKALCWKQLIEPAKPMRQ